MAGWATYTGPTAEDGRPLEFLDGIPARDIDEDERGTLTDEQVAAVGESGLYSVAGAAPSSKTTGTSAPSAETPAAEGGE